MNNAEMHFCHQAQHHCFHPLEPQLKSTTVHWQSNEQLRKSDSEVRESAYQRRAPVNMGPGKSEVLKRSLLIGCLKLTIAKDTTCTLEKQVPGRFSGARAGCGLGADWPSVKPLVFNRKPAF